VCRSKHVEQLRNIGIINSATRSHLVGCFYKIRNEGVGCDNDVIDFDGHVNVHRDKFLIIKPTRCTDFSDLFLE